MKKFLFRVFGIFAVFVILPLMFFIDLFIDLGRAVPAVCRRWWAGAPAEYLNTMPEFLLSIKLGRKCTEEEFLEARRDQD